MMNDSCRLLLLTLIVMTLVGGCRKEAPPSKPAPVPPVETSSETDAEDAVSVTFDGETAATLAEAMEEGKEKWVQVVAIAEGQPGAWVTGQFEPPNRIVIRVEGAKRFEMDLAKLDIDWDRRVVLRINDANSELRKRDDLRIVMEQSSGGAWYVVNDDTANSGSDQHN